MEFGLKGTSRLVADVTGNWHSGLGFTVFWLFMAVLLLTIFLQHNDKMITSVMETG